MTKNDSLMAPNTPKVSRETSTSSRNWIGMLRLSGHACKVQRGGTRIQSHPNIDTKNKSIGKDLGMLSSLMDKNRIDSIIKIEKIRALNIDKISFIEAYLQIP